MRNDIKLIVSDLDGTIAYIDRPISEENLDAIKRIKDKNIYFAVLSGRARATLKNRIDCFYDDNMFLVGCNGAFIYRKNELIYKKSIENEHLKKVCEIAKKMDTPITMNTLENLHALDTEFARKMKVRWDGILGKGNEVEFCFHDDHMNMVDSVSDNALSVVLFEKDQDKRVLLYNELKELSGISVTSSFDSNLEVMSESVTKAYALKNICNMLGIDIKDSMALGDNYNDLDMIKAAGVGIAMGNADTFIKNNADFVTKTCEENGFAYAVNKFI